MTLRRTRFFAHLGLWALILIGPAVARADVVFSNFGTGSNPAYILYNGNPVGSFGSEMSYAEGETFTPTQDYMLTSIQLPLSFAVTGDGPTPSGAISTPITVSLTSDAGNQPGTVLQSYTIPSNSVLSLSGNPNSPFIFNATANVVLTAGVQYWVTVSDGTTTDPIRWDWNYALSNTFNENAYSIDGGNTWNVPPAIYGGQIDGAFEVDGTFVPGGSPGISTPEPSGWVLAASGGGLWLLGVWLSRLLGGRRALPLG